MYNILFYIIHNKMYDISTSENMGYFIDMHNTHKPFYISKM